MNRTTLTGLLLAPALMLAACGDASVGDPIDHGYGGSTGGGGETAGDAAPPTSDGGAAQSGEDAADAGEAADTESSTQSAAFTVSLDTPSASVDLADSVVVHVSIKPNGYTGTVNLAMVSGLSLVTAAFSSASLSLDGETTATTDLTLTTTTQSPIGADSLMITATSTAGSASAPLALTVNAAITITIPANVDQNGGTTADPVTNAFGPYPMNIAGPANMSATNTLTVRFYNADTVPHEIHASSPMQGFAHDPGPFPAMSFDPLVRKVNATGTYDFYLHDQGGPSTIGRLIIQ